MFTFGSRYPGYQLVLDPGGPKYMPETGQFIPKVPFRGIGFNEGVYSTDDPKMAEELKKHPRYTKDFWEILVPSDAEKVNTGRRVEVALAAKGTGHMLRK